MDSIGVTVLRTGAATAVAARALARAGAGTLLIAGCGEQGRISVRMLERVRRLRRILLWDIDRDRAERLAGELQAERDGSAHIVVVDALRPVSLTADLIVTGTPSRVPLLGLQDVAPGTFIAAVGADSPDKQELDAALLAASAVVPDVLSQALVMGDLHHAVEAGVMTADDIRGELGDVLVGARPGRRSEEDVIVFDSTGAGLQDVALAAVAYERAVATGIGLRLDFNSRSRLT
jgi:ornithine cyclodeaminase/alanine dehydrogenase-like protein (mu-crystallin family)